MTIPQALQLAVQRHQARRLAEAEALYRQILAVQPRHADAIHLLGVIAHQVGRYDQAVDLICQAIALSPNHPVAHSNLGKALGAMGRLDEAIASYRRALALRPDYLDVCNNLGVALAQQGQLGEAVAAYRRAIELQPNSPDAYSNWGAALAAQGRFDEAMAAYRRAIELKPDFPEAHNKLGNALWEQGHFDEAILAYRRAIELKPDFPEAHNNLGAALSERGQLGEAITACRRALELKPDYPKAHNNLGNALREAGRFDESTAAYRRAIELDPHFPESYYNLGIALRSGDQPGEAVAAFRRAIALKPDFAEAHNHLGIALAQQGQFDEAIAAYRRALELKSDDPNAHSNLGNALRERGELVEAIASYRRALQARPEHAWAHSNLIFALHFHPGQNAGTISAEHQLWNRQFSDPLKQFLRPHANSRDPERRLRVGYVSPDFRDHAVGRFVLPLFERHDRERFEVLCYSGVTQADWMTERLRALASNWRSTVGVPDHRLAEMIREDGIDILVDLSLHTAGNRLTLFARQPAPVQVSWLGYPGGAGLGAIACRLTDAHIDPIGSRSRGTACSTEEAVRLPDCWCCYDPVEEAPEINALPALSAADVTFGSLNNLTKVHDGVLALWARVLEAVKRSRLLMFCPVGQARESVWSFFGARGIAAERVELADRLPRREYLRLYQRIDLGLDPFPCNGMTTTCDALWMGVPVLTLPGDMPVSRAGLSLLSTIGLGELAASSEEDYVRLAVEWAGNLPRLAELRATLRARMQASPLMDAPRFARNVEVAYQKMWQRWKG